MSFSLVSLVLGYTLSFLSWFGCPFIVPKKYKDATWRIAYQREIALPLFILGTGSALRWLNISQDIGLTLILVSTYLIFKVGNKYGQ